MMTDEELEQTVLPADPEPPESPDLPADPPVGDDVPIVPPAESPETPDLPPEPPVGDDVLIVPPAESPAPKNHKGLRIAAIVAASVVVLGVIAAFAVPAILKAVNPKVAVVAALGKTFDRAGFGDAAAIMADLGKTSGEFELSLHLGDQIPPSLNLGATFGVADEALSGSGFSLSVQRDDPNRKMVTNLGFDLGAYRAIDLRLFADDATLSFGSPELTGNRFYSVNTETLGADWAGNEFWSTIENVDPTISFNLFDPPAVSDKAPDLTEAVLRLNESIAVTKEGKNYLLTVPADALRAFLTEYSDQTAISDADSIVSAFTDDLTGTFNVEKGAITSMELTLPLTADGDDLALRLMMTVAEDGSLSFLLNGLDSSSNPGVSMSATLSVYTDKESKQVGFELPDILILANNETLSLSAGLTMEPMGEFFFQPEDPTPLFGLDENGVLELLLGALGGLQSVSESFPG